MKNIFYILLLLPTIIFAQYPSNSGQKITLGEQTTADGLVWRGVLNDTALITPSSDTSAYIILDTVNNRFYNYNRATNVWSLAGGGVSVSSFSAGTTGLTPSTATTGEVTLGGTLSVANGGTGQSTLAAAGINTGSGTLNYLPKYTATGTTLGNSIIFNNGSSVGIGTTSPNYLLDLQTTSTYVTNNLKVNASAAENNYAEIAFQLWSGAGSGENVFGGSGTSRPSAVIRALSEDNSVKGALLFATFTGGATNANLTEKMRITSGGEVWIGYTADNGAYPLQVNGQIFATNATIATSDEKFKENITPLNKGLEIVNKLKPVTFNFISDTKNNFSEYEEVGFIAQDVDRALSTETFSKSIVKSADDSEPTSTMGLATQNLIPILVKAIQEQQALIKALEQRILNLENK